MEDSEGYMTVEPSRHTYMDAIPKKMEGPSKCCHITLWIILGGSIAVNGALIVLLMVFQTPRVLNPSTSNNSCKVVPGIAIDSVTFDPDTAHRRLVISSNRKTATWGTEERPLPDIDQRFNPRVWVLGQNAFQTGKHCWEVEIKHNGEWGVGVASRSVKRKGLVEYTPKEGIWGIGEYGGREYYVAFTEPQHTHLPFGKKPRRIRVFVDYVNQQVEFFNVETKSTIFLFSNSSFLGETIYPWFRFWHGTELIIHP